MMLVYERTERRGPVFERLRRDVDAIAAITGSTARDLKLRSARHRPRGRDRAGARGGGPGGRVTGELRPGGDAIRRLARLSERLARSPDLDSLVGTTLAGLAELFGYELTCCRCSSTSAANSCSRSGATGTRARASGPRFGSATGSSGWWPTGRSRCAPATSGGCSAYARTVRRTGEEGGGEAPGLEIPLPGLENAESQVAVPALVLGQLVGVVAIESAKPGRFGPEDEALLDRRLPPMVRRRSRTTGARAPGDATRLPASVVATRLGSDPPSSADDAECASSRSTAAPSSTATTPPGVAGRAVGVARTPRAGRPHRRPTPMARSTCRREPAQLRDLESAFLVLKRRLDERDAPIRIEKTGRGRFRLLVDGDLRLEEVEADR